MKRDTAGVGIYPFIEDGCSGPARRIRTAMAARWVGIYLLVEDGHY